MPKSNENNSTGVVGRIIQGGALTAAVAAGSAGLAGCEGNGQVASDSTSFANRIVMQAGGEDQIKAQLGELELQLLTFNGGQGFENWVDDQCKKFPELERKLAREDGIRRNAGPDFSAVRTDMRYTELGSASRELTKAAARVRSFMADLKERSPEAAVPDIESTLKRLENVGKQIEAMPPTSKYASR